QAGEHARQDRRGHVEQVADRHRAAQAGVDQAGARRQDDRDAARRAVRHDRREHRDQAVRTVRGRRGVSERQFTRVLLKLSGEALMGERSYGQDPERIAAVARAVREVAETGLEIAIVVGGGNILRGTQEAAQGMDRATADYAGMLATVLNALTVQDALEKLGVY